MPDPRKGPLRHALPWIPLALGVSAIVVGGVLHSPHPAGDSGFQSHPAAVSASP